MNDYQGRYKRIAKNTMALYFRSLISMIVGLYTGRIMLEALGIDNYGIQNVVGGIVAFSSLIVGTTSAASSRYITFALGVGNIDKMKNVFTTVANVQIIMGLTAVVFLEIGGVWFLNYYANIPDGRMFAANWVLQCSILTTFIGLISTPYISCIIAHERMAIYAWMSIVDALIKLAICYIIMYYNRDRLILYASLLVSVQIIMTIFYSIYSHINFEEVRYRFKIDKMLLKEMASYSGWNLFGNTSWIMNTQGVNMLINIFFGVAYNAARGVANTVNGCIQGFVENFMMAFRPQITKSYAAGDLSYCTMLVTRCSKFTWLLMLVFIVPVCLEAKMLLSIWLVEVPPMAVIFLQFVMFDSLALKYSQPLFTLIQATGKVKNYTIAACLYGCVIFPFTWILYKLGAPVWATYPVGLFVRFSIIIIRIPTLKRLINFDGRGYMKEAVLPGVICTVLSFIPLIPVVIFWNDSILRFVILVPLSIVWTIFVIYCFGLNRPERNVVISKLSNRFKFLKLEKSGV